MHPKGHDKDLSCGDCQLWMCTDYIGIGPSRLWQWATVSIHLCQDD